MTALSTLIKTYSENWHDGYCLPWVNNEVTARLIVEMAARPYFIGMTCDQTSEVP
jgi:hypothetical protein